MREGDRALLGPRGSKCDQYGTCHGTEPIILPFHDDELNAARWLRDIELRWPAHGDERRRLPLFPDENGRPFKDAAFAALIRGGLVVGGGAARAGLVSPHSGRAWLASALRMCGASDARIQAMGRWLNPESIKIYARMTKDEYAHWVDRLMGVTRIDTARTTNLPIMDRADALALWGAQLGVDKKPMVAWGEVQRTAASAVSAPLKAGTRISVFWTEMNEWFVGTYQCSRVETSDNGDEQRASCVVYDATGPWAKCSRRNSTFWHCLDDEQWVLASATTNEAI